MGNAEILGAYGAAGQVVAPPNLRVLWTVYELRRAGEKLPRDEVMRTGKTGELSLWRSQVDGRLSARLTHPRGDPVLANLCGVEVISGTSEGLLLHGHALQARRGDIIELPQAWWCMVRSANQRPPTAPLAAQP